MSLMFLGNLRKFCTDFLILCVFCKHLEFFDQKILLGQQIINTDNSFSDNWLMFHLHILNLSSAYRLDIDSPKQ